MGRNKQQHNKEHAKIWQTEPGLVALYDIQPGNGGSIPTTPEPTRGQLLKKFKSCKGITVKNFQ